MKKPRVLFILKKALGYNGCPVPSKGLFNSASFVVNALRAAKVEANLVEVVDNNDIDRAVTAFRPTHCIIEALWVVPEKFDLLRSLHPKVNFVVRIHSKTPFLASEGMAIEWLRRYDVPVAFNATEAVEELGRLLKEEAVYLPNIYYPKHDPSEKELDRTGPNLWVGSLGAIRPMKNQLLQAVAAMRYAEDTGRNLIFHINDRVEQGGEQVRSNLRALFADTPHRLVEQPWCDSHEDLLHVVASLDISMQVSFTETFNIASADAVWSGVPAMSSPQVEWMPTPHTAEPTAIESIIHVMRHVERSGLRGTQWALRSLVRYNERALHRWLAFLK